MPISPINEIDADSDLSTVGFLNGQWIDTAMLALPMSDQGFRQGVTAVERLRTYQRRIFQKDAHLVRWQQTVDALMISQLPSTELIADLLDQLVHRNQRAVDQWLETGITMVATPGETGGERPTFALHLNRLDLQAIDRRQRQGQPLVVTAVMQPPPESWSRRIKVRSRLHYYLADHQARTQSSDAVGVLLDTDGTMTETSIANIAIVEAGRIVSPPAPRVLGGITQAVVQQLAQMQSLSWTNEAISIDRLKRADEVLLMGTDAGIWFANRVDDTPLADGEPGPIYRMLRDSFDHLTSSC